MTHFVLRNLDNPLYGFLFVRPAIYAGGGEVEVTHFVLRNLDNPD